MRAHGLSGFLAVLAFTLLASDAYAQCPSKYYFRTDATNAVQPLETKLNSTVCLSVSTRPALISAKAVITVEVADVKKLQAALVNMFAGEGTCASNSLGGYDVKDVNISFAGVGSATRVRVNVVGKNCLYLAHGWNLTYQASVSTVVSGLTLSFAVDPKQARVTFTKGGGSVPLVFALAANQITNTLNGFLSKPIDLGPYISTSQTTLRYASELNPKVTQATFVLQSNRLKIKANVSGQVKKQDADRELTNAVQQQFIPAFLQWLRNPTLPTS